MPLLKFIIPLALAFGGLLFASLELWQMRKTKKFVRRARRAAAFYVGRSLETAPTDIGGAAVYRRYQFVAADGKTYGCESIVGGSPFQPKNKTVEVLYDPQNPNESRINSRLKLYGAAWIMLASGAGFMLAAPIAGFLLLIKEGI